MTVGVFGLGRFGSFWSALLASRFDVAAFDIDPSRALPEGVRRVTLQELCSCDLIFLCVTIRAVPQALASIAPLLKPGILIADTCSVKVEPARWMREILPPHAGILATHPMFGPESAKDGLEGLSVMMDPVRASEDDVEYWSGIFRSFGLNVVRMSCDQHDREAAYSQALTHFVGRSLSRMGLPDTAIATRWFERLQAVVRQCVRDAPELFEDMQRFNPYSERMRNTVMESFMATMAELDGDKTEAKAGAV